MPTIEVNNVTKEYRLGQLKSLKQSALNMFSRMRGNEVSKQHKFKALDNISFNVNPGEVVGIIGTNGAGKSTILKILARISVPTRGEVKVKGSVAPLIEVGAGLHPELTGRENIYLNSSILGIPRDVIKKKFDEIVNFAELKEFIDTPLKRYSSGMKIRLGFAVATSVDPDILIIDEVLAVGDLAFQRKCFDKMEDLIKRRGKTVLIVSHNIRQVERICSRVILLDQGKILADNLPSEVCSLYFKRSDAKIQSYMAKLNIGSSSIKSSGEVELINIEVVDSLGNQITDIQPFGDLRVRVLCKFNRSFDKPEFIVGIHRTDFIYLVAGSTAVFNDRPNYRNGVHSIDFILPSIPFVAGTYCIWFAVCDKYRRSIFVGEGLRTFCVASVSKEARLPARRMLDLPMKWKLDGKWYAASSSILHDTEVENM